MNAYTISDMTAGEDWEFCWWALVWAESEQQALEWGRENYSGEGPRDQVVLSVHGTHPELVKKYKPEGDLPCHERRPQVERDAGWMSESDTQCECCERYSLGYPDWAVCDACYYCPECADGKCECCNEALAN